MYTATTDIDMLNPYPYGNSGSYQSNPIEAEDDGEEVSQVNEVESDDTDEMDGLFTFSDRKQVEKYMNQYGINADADEFVGKTVQDIIDYTLEEDLISSLYSTNASPTTDNTSTEENSQAKTLFAEEYATATENVGNYDEDLIGAANMSTYNYESTFYTSLMSNATYYKTSQIESNTSILERFNSFFETSMEGILNGIVNDNRAMLQGLKIIDPEEKEAGTIGITQEEYDAYYERIESGDDPYTLSIELLAYYQ